MPRPLRALAAASTAALLLTAPALPAHAAAAAEPGSATVVPLQVTGDPSDRFNLIIMGDGYTENEQSSFAADADLQLNVLWSIEPYKSYRNYFNVYRVDIVSGESGVGCDPDLAAGRKNTPLSMGFYGGCSPSGLQRLITMSNSAATRYANMVPGTSNANRQIVALANSGTYGGAGGAYATASGHNSMSALIAPHEIGHSLGNLQDEYTYYSRGVDGGPYTDGEPGSAHHTLLTEQQMKDQRQKWWRWLGEPGEAGGVIGRYEGGLYKSSGVWRPSRHSIMRTLGYYYDQVGREVMTKAIAAKVSLIQDNTPTGAPVGADRVLWVEPLHPNSHSLVTTWQVDGADVPAQGGELDLRALNLAPGTHKVTATVVDPTEFVRDPAIRSAGLTATRTWTVDTAVTTTPAEPGTGFLSSTPTNRGVGREEVVYVETPHPDDSVPPVVWALDGKPLPDTDEDVDLGALDLAPGAHTLTATSGGQTLTWAVDDLPATGYELSEPLVRSGENYVYNGPFTMKLTGADDEPGYVVNESRVDGDGWFNYFGWPTSADLPWTFSETGTTIDSLTYGALPRGRHTVEYRSIDASGNRGEPKSFSVTTLAAPPACTTTVTGVRKGAVAVRSGVTCLENAEVSGAVTVAPGASLVVRGGTVRGGLVASGAAEVHLLKARVEGAVVVNGTTGHLTVAGADIRGAITLTGNTTADALVVTGSTVSGSLACAGNTPQPSDAGVSNDVTGSGQCAGLVDAPQSKTRARSYEAVLPIR
ncbi:M64 family metallopeptidase [Microtetraspora sp. NBRC 13810]|uniref:M64 family metallopeptidase n=1 Tax=Microtetraspora sp. NBRC 13810 TaxID=3030990 RepID=UPI002552843C|nr:M64 family metallopeptidase [Microtetraspora sp. NBRC 13810]